MGGIHEQPKNRQNYSIIGNLGITLSAAFIRSFPNTSESSHTPRSAPIPIQAESLDEYDACLPEPNTDNFGLFQCLGKRPTPSGRAFASEIGATFCARMRGRAFCPWTCLCSFSFPSHLCLALVWSRRSRSRAGHLHWPLFRLCHYPGRKRQNSCTKPTPWKVQMYPIPFRECRSRCYLTAVKAGDFSTLPFWYPPEVAFCLVRDKVLLAPFRPLGPGYVGCC